MFFRHHWVSIWVITWVCYACPNLSRAMEVKGAPDSVPGPHFTNGFSIAIQIRWNLRFTLISILMQWSLQNLVHGTTAVLSWHVQNSVAISWPLTELQQGDVSIKFELRTKMVSETGPSFQRNLKTHMSVNQNYAIVRHHTSKQLLQSMVSFSS